MKRNVMLLLLALMVALSGWCSGDEPDFNYPKKVTAQADADLKKALAGGDGQLVVDAIVRASIAQSQLSREQMSAIVDRIERTTARESKPDIKALLRHFEAVVMHSYMLAFVSQDRYGDDIEIEDPNPEATRRDPYAQWTRDQLQQRIDELVVQSLADSAALCACQVTAYPRIIGCNKLGASYVPTLYQFLISHSVGLASSGLKRSLYKSWTASTAALPVAHTWAQKQLIDIDNSSSGERKAYRELIARQPAEEVNGLLLDDLNEDCDYGLLRDYLKRYPKSVYAADVRNNIAHIERQSVDLSHDGQWNSRDPFDVRVRGRNVQHLCIDIYRLADSMCAPNWTGKRYEVKNLQRVRSHEFDTPGTVPFDTAFTVSLPPLPYGKYLLVPRYTNLKGHTTTLEQVERKRELAIYDLASFGVSDNGGTDRLVVVDVATGASVAGATVGDEHWTGTTGADGTVALPEHRGYSTMNYYVSRGGDHYGPGTLFRRLDEQRTHRNGCSLFTDLAIYRPGETMRFAGIVYTISVTQRRPMPGVEATVTLSDANGRKVESQTLTTDAYGRVEGTFAVPTGRLLGTYKLTMVAHISGPQAEASHSVQVSEYKTPTFHVDLADSDLAYEPGQPVTVTGTARTYTDLPVAGAQVKLSLTKREWDWLWWRRPMVGRMRSAESIDTVAVTDADGRFAVTFAPEQFYENRQHSFCRYIYTTQVQVTSAAGESQLAQGTFHIGSRRELALTGELKDINNVRAVRVPVVVNTSDSTLLPERLSWTLMRSYSDTVASGTMPLADPVIDLTAYPSGHYRLAIAIAGGYGYSESKTADINLYRTTDAAAPVADVPLWVATDGYSVDDRNVAHITIGTSVPVSHVYYVACSRERVVKQGWLDLRSGVREFTLQVPSEPDEVLDVKFTSVYRTTFYTRDVHLTSPVNARPLRVKASAFRDRLTPGKPERWQLQLLGRGDKPQRGAMMLEMIDRAIHDLQDNSWRFAPAYVTCTPSQLWTMHFDGSRQNGASWRADYLESASGDYTLPRLINYGMPMWNGCAIRIYSSYDRMLGSAAGGRVLMKDGRVEEAPAAIDEATADAEAPAVDRSRLDQVQLRMADVKTALWQPLLESDEQGNITLEFDAPDFNTTWLVQALAYTGELSTARWAHDVLTRKPIMVKPALPRFVRQGDQLSLAATLQNATGERQQCDALIELFDPRTGQVYAEQAFRPTLDPQATQALTIGWTVPDTLAYVGFRVRAAGADFSDGEQTLLPVLTAVSPIVESLPFYVGNDQATFTALLPHTPQPARYTIEYCDNPVWYTVMALPSVASADSHVATSIAHSLYAVDVAQGVARSQPIIAEAVRYWTDNCQDSVLVSALSRNSDLKIGTLQASPWLNASERQTLQMRRLVAYFDSTEARAEHDRLVRALADLQMPDGGFAWYRYPQCKSSVWTTGEVLELIGEIRDLRYLPADDNLRQMLARAVAYYEQAYVAESKKKVNKKAIFADYAYVRALYPDVPMTKAGRKLLERTLKAMGKQWGKQHLSLSQKAFWALTLERAGRHKQAMPIVESIREFALSDPQRGIYWDSYRSGGWFTPAQVAVTSTVLQALHAVDRQEQELDQVRKWMLLSKQTTDWGGGSMAADATYALLSTGSQWLERAQQPAISIDNQPVTMDRFDAYTGYCRRSIDAHGGSQLSIERSGNSPAWGAVYWQYSQPMSQVQPAATPDLSIHKDFYVLSASGKPMQGALKVGDKVQVRLTIGCGRDIDYLTIVDERPSCFEPVDRTSGYRSGDGLGYYRETRDSGTNIFVASMDKGTHVITYEVTVTAPGSFSSGVATIQCQQAPEQVAHSEGNILYIQSD